MHGTPAPITETGCLTAADGRFVLTNLESAAALTPDKKEASATAAAQPTTESYQLVGNEGELHSFVGKQVRVTGEADAPQVAVVRESTPAAQPQATGTSGGQVTTEAQTRLEIRKLRVSSISATGENCAAEGKPRG